jgi:hypothetical protein
VSGYLPNDPARQQTTGHKQHTSAKRDQRRTTRGWERASSRSRSSSATAAATGSRSRSGTAAATAHVDVDRAVLKRSGLAEARQHLLLVDAKALGSPSSRTGALTGLVLRFHGSLDLVTRVLQDRNIPTSRRLAEGRGRGCKHHRQHRCH